MSRWNSCICVKKFLWAEKTCQILQDVLKYPSMFKTLTKGEIHMAKECYFTGRKAKSGNNRSHSLRASKRTFKPNLQKVRVLIDGKPKRVWVSARALKSGQIERV